MNGEAPVLHERDLLVLAKMLAMLGTSNDAERSVVGAKVHAWVTQRGVVWADLLIPPEPPEVEVSVNVGGRPAAASGNGQARAHTSPHPGSQKPAQAPPGAQHSNSATGHNWARGPAWGPLAETMLAYRRIGFGTFIVELPAPYDHETMESLIQVVKPMVDAA